MMFQMVSFLLDVLAGLLAGCSSAPPATFDLTAAPGAKGVHALGDIVAGALRADHGVRAGGSILCAGHLEAGWGILAGQRIVAEGAIKAGESINAGDDIRAGGGYGIFAGLNVRSDSWDCCARVTARTKPTGLMSGSWDDRLPDSEQAAGFE